MTLVEHLSRLHREIPGCRVVLYGDMETATVLRACTDTDLWQEQHDADLAEAVLCLGPAAERLIEQVYGAGPDAAVVRAVCVDAAEARFYLRAGDRSQEVLCATVGADGPIAEVGPALRRIGIPDD